MGSKPKDKPKVGGREPLLIVLLFRFTPYFDTTDPVTVELEIFVVVEQVYSAPLTLLEPDTVKSGPWFKISPLTLLPLMLIPPFVNRTTEFAIEFTLDPRVLLLILISPLLAISIPPVIVQFVMFIFPVA